MFVFVLETQTNEPADTDTTAPALFMCSFVRHTRCPTKVKNMIKSTNLSFGNAPTLYRTMATDQMDLQSPPQGDRGAQLEKNRQLKVRLVALCACSTGVRRLPCRGA